MTWSKEWENLRELVERVGYGTIEIRVQNGKPVVAVRVVQTFKLDQERKREEGKDNLQIFEV